MQYHATNTLNNSSFLFLLTGIKVPFLRRTELSILIYSWKDDSDDMIMNGTISNNIPSSSGSVEGMMTYSDTLIQDPMFMNTTIGSEDLRLTKGSPAIAAGLNQAIASTTDLDGKTRLIGTKVDMGAYEYGDNQDCSQTVFLHPQSFIDQTAAFTSNQLIYATNKIVSTNITYDAMLGVELELQFEVTPGALFEAKLIGCP